MIEMTRGAIKIPLPSMTSNSLIPRKKVAFLTRAYELHC